MLYCRTPPMTPEANLAADEALLDACEAGELNPVLRIWLPQTWFVVVGYANCVNTEVNVVVCASRGIPVLRRCTGGGTVLQGPGCLNYSLVLRIEPGPLESIPATNAFVLSSIRDALAPLLGPSLARRGETDLALGGRKIAGNAQRRRRNHLLFHGSILLNLDLELVGQVLPMPSHRPDYRANRGHQDFMLNLGLDATVVEQALRSCWDAWQPMHGLPAARIRSLVEQKYGRAEWNLRF